MVSVKISLTNRSFETVKECHLVSFFVDFEHAGKHNPSFTSFFIHSFFFVLYLSSLLFHRSSFRL